MTRRQEENQRNLPNLQRKVKFLFLFFPAVMLMHVNIMLGQKVVAVIEATAAVCVERFAEHPQMGRFTLRDEGTANVISISNISDNFDL